jgi:hypothetical protein
MYATTPELIESVYRCLPHSEQIKDLSVRKDSIQISWRSQKFRISLGGSVEQVEGVLLTTDDISLLFRKILHDDHIKQLKSK